MTLLETYTMMCLLDGSTALCHHDQPVIHRITSILYLCVGERESHHYQRFF